MAASSLAIDTDDVIAIANDTANDADDVGSNIDLIVDAFNDAFDTSTGHAHDGTDSKSISSGFAGLTILETQVALVMGVFD